MEIVEGKNASNDVRESSRDGGINAVRVMEHAIDEVVVNPSLEGIFHLVYAAGEVDPAAAGSHIFNRKALRCEPRLYSGEVGIADAEALAILLRSQPFMV